MVAIEAVYFDGTGQGHCDVDSWAQSLIERGRANRPVGRPDGAVFNGDMHGIYIETADGRVLAEPGDWIMCGVDGEFHPYRPD